ncbi:oligosaccharide flippase family protein [Variovorax paradoxus]|uniref:Oligosaccharide flippase family protein n=1 Tax=Variovorax paradoxus TaxID=34073 RepID=A0A5Q0LXZ2_VARPD|nr:oligosaccharide flippase family protein [Variovorax paradoxus]QFZ81417.1 oligosaccharide flippase family protein [Variovorax paradoxus]
MFAQLKKLIIGNGAAQALQFISIILLSRIYSPSDFGFLAQVQAVATVSAIVITLQLHLTIPLNKNESEARHRVEQVQLIGCAIFGLCIIPAIYIGKLAVFSAFLAFFLGLTNTYSSFFIFSGNFGGLSIFYIARAILIVGLQIGFSIIGVQDGLVLGAVISEGVVALCLKIFFFKRLGRWNFDLAGAWRMALENRSFSIYGTLQELISVAAFYAPLIFFSQKYGENIGGQYAMANRLIWAPTALLSRSLAQVLYHQFGKNPLASRADFLTALPSNWIYFFLALCCCGAFYLPSIFLFMLGAQWELASKLIPLQLTWCCFFLSATPFRVACRALHLQKYQLAVDFFMLISIFLLFNFSSFSPLNLMISLVGLALIQNASLCLIVWRMGWRNSTPNAL